MSKVIGVADAKRMLRSSEELRGLGWSERRMRGAVEHHELVRIRRGWFVPKSAWTELWPEGRHLLEVVAAFRDMVGGSQIFSYFSAAVLWGLPLFRTIPKVVHLTGLSGMQASNTSGVLRHEDRLAEEDIVTVDGIRCTSLERTIFDLLRVATPEAAVAVADAGLRLIATRGRDYSDTEDARWREAMAARAFDAGAARGIRQARWVTDFADGRAQLPGESVSRLQIVRLKFERPRLQVPVPGPDGTTYWVDIGLDDVFAFGEFDGKGKYQDEALRHGLTLEEVLLREKQREDWIRGTTQRRFARWGDEHIASPALLGARLGSFGIRPRD